MTDHEHTVSRRRVLRGAAGGVAAGVTGGVALQSSAAAQSGGEPDYDGWFDGVDNYDGTVDATGQDEASVTVGAQGNGAAFAFDPAAVRVDPGTAVVWEWTGDGGEHDVAAEDADFQSELTDEAGHVFEHAFDEPGTYRYACTPHEAIGMKGAVVVGDPDEAGAEGDGAAAGSGAAAAGGDGAVAAGGLGLVGVLLALFYGQLRGDADERAPRAGR